ncbi:MAG: hypothetical protein ACLFR5_03660 [Halobacteriales archaeon]
MTGTTVAAGENVQGTYFRRLVDVLGAKGAVALIAFPVSAVASSTVSDTTALAVGGFVFTTAFLYALVVDRERSPTDDFDPVGVAFAVLAAGYTVLAVTGVGVGALVAFVGAVVVLGAVVYGYVFHEGVPDDLSSDALTEIEADPLHIDVVGFAVAEILVVYSVLLGTGWGEFARSQGFAALAFVVYVGTVAVFAGYAVVTREIVVSRTDDEVHELLFGVLGDMAQIDDAVLRDDVASKMRLVAECLDGVKLPTVVEDKYGEVPVVVSTRRPDARRVEVPTDEVFELAKEREFTGYVVHGDAVLLFRNGVLAKWYADGEYGHDADGLEDRVSDATFHSLDHTTLNHLDDVTPQDEDVVEPDEVEPEDDEDDDTDDTGGSKTLNVGGEEIDMEEMFEKADEVMEELE